MWPWGHRFLLETCRAGVITGTTERAGIDISVVLPDITFVHGFGVDFFNLLEKKTFILNSDTPFVGEPSVKGLAGTGFRPDLGTSKCDAISFLTQLCFLGEL